MPYSTVKELHIALDVAVQSLNSEKYRTFQPEEKDLILNEAVDEYVLTRMGDQLDTHQIGLGATNARLDELFWLLKTDTFPLLHVAGLTDSYDYNKLHNNIQYIVDVATVVNYNACKENMAVVPLTRNQFKVSLPLATIVSAPTYYANFTLSYIKQTAETSLYTTKVYVPVLTFDSFKSSYVITGTGIFRLIDTICECINNLKLDIPFLFDHDECATISCDYNTLTSNFEITIDYYTPKVILTGGSSVDEIAFVDIAHWTIPVPPTASVIATIAGTTSTYTANGRATSYGTSPIAILKPDIYSDTINNSVAMLNRYRNPIGKIETDSVKIHSDFYYHSAYVRLTYIKYPLKYDYITGQMCEITDNEGILRIAVRLVEGRLLDKDANAYQVTDKTSVIVN